MSSPTAGSVNSRCYAHALGDCSDDITREHYVSEGLLERVGVDGMVYVSNLAFQDRHVFRGIPAANLNRRVLCSCHNQRLSRVIDPSILPLYDGIEHMHISSSEERTFRVDGDAVERWMLKMLCGGLFSGHFVVPPLDTMRGVPIPEEWIRIIFRDEEFRSRQGLYLVLEEPNPEDNLYQSRLRVTPLLSQEDQVVIGVQVWVFNLKFVLLAASPPTDVVTWMDYNPYRPSGIATQDGMTRIEINWRRGTRTSVVEFQRAAEGDGQ